MRGRVLLLVDLSYQVYRASASHPDLESADGTFTGGLYGFLATLAKTVRDTRATRAAFCMDTKPYVRSREFPAYKQLRGKPMQEELRKAKEQSMELVLEMLAVAGFAPWSVQGFESDDLIAAAAIAHRGRYEHVYAATNDSDLWQLFWIENFHVYRKEMSDLADIRELRRLGLTPEQFMLVTAITGTHNDVPGIAGVGPVKGRKIVLDPQLLRACKAEHGAMIERNLRLIRLPHPTFPRGARMPGPVSAFKARDVARWLGRYDITFTAPMEEALRQLHGGAYK